MVVGSAVQFMALDTGSRLFAVLTESLSRTENSAIDVDQTSVSVFENFGTPQSTVDVDPVEFGE